MKPHVDHPDGQSAANVPRRWGTGRILLAYGLMVLLAAASIWFIDRKVHHQAESPEAPATTPPVSSPAR